MSLYQRGTNDDPYLRDPQAVAAKTWVTPRSFKARRLAR